MEPNQKFYDLSESARRIEEILQSTDASFPERTDIPPRSMLTFANGYYVKPAAMVVDLRGSSKIIEMHKRPVIARMYRAYLSEIVAVVNDSANCRDISIEGDGLLAVFEASKKAQINEVFGIAARVNAVVGLLNCKFEKKDTRKLR